jgi:hypothetical protein
VWETLTYARSPVLQSIGSQRIWGPRCLARGAQCRDTCFCVTSASIFDADTRSHSLACRHKLGNGAFLADVAICVMLRRRPAGTLLCVCLGVCLAVAASNPAPAQSETGTCACSRLPPTWILSLSIDGGKSGAMQCCPGACETRLAGLRLKGGRIVKCSAGSLYWARPAGAHAQGHAGAPGPTAAQHRMPLTLATRPDSIHARQTRRRSCIEWRSSARMRWRGLCTRRQHRHRRRREFRSCTTLAKNQARRCRAHVCSLPA